MRATSAMCRPGTKSRRAYNATLKTRPETSLKGDTVKEKVNRD
jgi:hypothetical protein